MVESFDALRFEQALAHQGQLLRLAQRLLGDPDAAEDAVGHALLQESRGRRGGGVPLGRFLAAAVRNCSRRLRRDAARRQRHETAAARDAVAPAADELAAREQLRRQVAAAVLALAEPYRTTVALVYLEQQPVAEVAARLRVAEATIRVRLHRAREQLRQRLRAWRRPAGVPRGPAGMWACLALGARAAAPAGIVGGLLMKKLTGVAAAALLLLGGLLAAFWPGDGAPASTAPVAAVVTTAVAEREAEPLARRFEVAPAPAAATADAAVQRFRCVDEAGRPVAGAEVSLEPRPASPGHAVRTQRSGADGAAEFEGLAPGCYACRASAGPRHHVPDLDHLQVQLPSPPADIVLREPWVGGLLLPGAEPMQWQSGVPHGFRGTQDRQAEDAITAAMRARHPGAVFWTTFRSDRGGEDTIDVKVHWYGFARHRQRLRMWPLSTFPGPEVLDPAALTPTPWASVRIVLVDAHGEPLPERLQAALRERADLEAAAASGSSRSLDGRRTVAQPGASYGFRGGTARVPVGPYRLRLGRGVHMLPVAECTIAADVDELRLPVGDPGRLLRLRIRDAGAGYVLQIAHENGLRQLEFGRADGEHALLLPPGLCLFTLQLALTDGGSRMVERSVAITDAWEQEVDWPLLNAK